MAIGAHPRDVFKLIMQQGVLQTSLALCVGLGLALGVGQLLGSFLYQVSKGSGHSAINGKRFDWNERDIFCVPSWAFHEHANASETWLRRSLQALHSLLDRGLAIAHSGSLISTGISRPE